MNETKITADTSTVSVRIPDDLLKAIDDFSFGHRIRSRNKVIRLLIASGLEAEKSRR